MLPFHTSKPCRVQLQFHQPVPPAADRLTTAVRDARRELYQRIRTDWHYPALAGEQEPTLNSDDVRGWRERTYASSDLSASDGEAHQTEDDDRITFAGVLPKDAPSPTLPQPKSRKPRRPYLFTRALFHASNSRSTSSRDNTGNESGSGDSAGSVNAHQLRQQAGSPLSQQSHSPDSPDDEPQDETIVEEDDDDEKKLELQETERLRQKADRRRRRRRQRLDEELAWNEGLQHWAAQRDAWTCAQRRPPVFKPSQEDTPMTDDKTLEDEEVMIPIAPPILPTSDPTRAAQAGTSLYPSIYSKVVLQSLAPSVPINLGTMIPALVEGWKKDGEWPPSVSNQTQPQAQPQPQTQTQKKAKDKASPATASAGSSSSILKRRRERRKAAQLAAGRVGWDLFSPHQPAAAVSTSPSTAAGTPPSASTSNSKMSSMLDAAAAADPHQPTSSTSTLTAKMKRGLHRLSLGSSNHPSPSSPPLSAGLAAPRVVEEQHEERSRDGQGQGQGLGLGLGINGLNEQ